MGSTSPTSTQVSLAAPALSLTGADDHASSSQSTLITADELVRILQGQAGSSSGATVNSQYAESARAGEQGHHSDVGGIASCSDSVEGSVSSSSSRPPSPLPASSSCSALAGAAEAATGRPASAILRSSGIATTRKDKREEGAGNDDGDDAGAQIQTPTQTHATSLPRQPHPPSSIDPHQLLVTTTISSSSKSKERLGRRGSVSDSPQCQGEEGESGHSSKPKIPPLLSPLPPRFPAHSHPSSSTSSSSSTVDQSSSLVPAQTNGSSSPAPHPPAPILPPQAQPLPHYPAPPSPRKLIIFDLRPLDDFLQHRIVGSINLALPSLVLRRMRRSAVATLSKASSAPSPASASSSSHYHLAHLGDYITTTSGKRKFEEALDSLTAAGGRGESGKSPRTPASPLDLWKADVVVVMPHESMSAASGSSMGPPASQEASRTLAEALDRLESPHGQIRGRNMLVKGDVSSLLSRQDAAAFIERGLETTAPSHSTTLGRLRRHPSSEAGPSRIKSPRSPSSAVSALAPPPQKPPTPPSSRPMRPGRPSLARLDTGDKVQTLGSLATNGSKASNVAASNSAPVRAGDNNLSLRVPSTSRTTHGTPVSGAAMSLQGLAHLQAKLPPSPASFGDMSLPMSPSGHGAISGIHPPPVMPTSNQLGREMARRGSHQPFQAGTTTLENLATEAASTTPFDVSTVIPSFLYLGPDITTKDEVDQLRSLGIRRILNCAAEVSDKSSGDGDLSLRPPDFDGYLHIPMYDNVEAANVQEDITTACAFLDQARREGAPVYVHCRAGKSRSVSVVIGWLIHEYKWPLKKAYKFVSERRKDVSPNIGFISCLMAFEEMTLREKKDEGGGGAVRERE